MQTVIPITLFLLTGVLLGRLSRRHAGKSSPSRTTFGLPDNFAESLTGFVIFVSLPALILVRMPSLRISTDLLVPILMPWVMIVFTATLVLVATRAFQWSNDVRTLLLLLVPLGNTSFLGIPMVESFFGDDKVRYALLYDQFGSFLGLTTYGAVVVSLYRKEKTPGQSFAKDVMRRIMFFPPFLALIIAMVLPEEMPPPILSFLEPLGGTLVPLVMIAVGSSLRLNIASGSRVPLVVGLGLKLVVAPLVALGGCRLLGIGGDAADVSVFEAGMPPMISAWAVAVQAGLDPELGSALVSLGILVSFVTLTLLFHLL